METLHIQPNTDSKKGIITTIPGDKSISHRAIIIGSLAKNKSTFSNFLCSEDCLNTAAIFQQLGVPIIIDTKTKTVSIQGVGLSGLRPPKKTLYVGNSGTGIRLITGVLAGQTFETLIEGDSSIQKRPMKRITDPLLKMGAQINGSAKNNDIYPPLSIHPSHPLSGIHYTLPIASAQVKSALLFASLFAKNNTIITEPKFCRNHTEIMLKGYGADIKINQHTITCSGQNNLQCPTDNSLMIPSDFSSAAFFIVLGLCSPNTKMTLKNIGLNPTRATLIDILKQMGARIDIKNIQGQDFERYGDIHIQSSKLTNIEIPTETIPFIIDELPILAVAAAFGEGTMVVKKAKELRVKESDRIATIHHLMTQLEVPFEEYDDGFTLTGKKPTHPFTANSFGDHRIAMSAAIAATAANIEATIQDTACIKTSFPNFKTLL